MSQEIKKLLEEIEAYCEATGQAPSTFCLRVVKNGTLYQRLKEGGDCRTMTIETIRLHINENPPDERDQEDAA